MVDLPTGTVTFLFTDIEGSTTLAQQFPDALPALLARHHAILREAIEAHHGHVFQIIGDAFCAAFYTASDALNAALDAQRGLQHEAWQPAPVKVRMGLHTGAAQAGAIEDRAGGYVGYLTLTRVQRVMSTAYGGQVLLSNPTAELVRGELPADLSLRDLNEHRLKGLVQPEHLWQLVAPGLTAEFPALKSLSTLPNNLPLQLTSFVGREKEMANIKALLNSARLVTLTGSGGTGKTRLALEVGTEALASFANGVWLIELASLSNPAQIIPALAQAFGLQELPFTSLANLVVDYLRDKKLLLLLDNCEHLIETCARLANDLLHHCAGLKILASSREALGIAGEMAYRTPSLAESESTRLFVERACAANPKFSLTDSNASSVAQICRRLDGIPLAIELAAARTKLLSPEQIAARLDDLFRLLVGGSRTALPRQQTLRALIDWSYDLLSDEEKRLLQYASVFVGGWTLEALEAVSEDPNAIEHLEGLINKSLVVTEEHESEMRYFLLETIRQYAREKLFEAKQAAAARDRHFVYFDELAEGMYDGFYSRNLGNDPAKRSRAEDEVENLRAALEWGLENHTEDAIRLAGNFCMISGWIGNLQTGALELSKIEIDRFKALPPVDGNASIQRQKLLAKALFAQGNLGLGRGDNRVVLQDFQEAVANARAAGDKRILGYSLGMFFTAAMFINTPGAAEAAEEGFRIFRDEFDDLFGLVMAYQNMARIATIKGNHDEKNKYIAKAKDLLKEMPMSFQSGLFFFSMGMNERIQNNYESAKTYFKDGLAIFKNIRNKNFELAVTSELGHVARHTGDIIEAKRIYKETLEGWQNLGIRGAVANQLECFGSLAITDEEPQRTAKLLGAAEALREKAHSPMTDYERIEYDQSVAQLHAMLPQVEFNALWAEGRAMTMEQAIEVALGQ